MMETPLKLRSVVQSKRLTDNGYSPVSPDDSSSSRNQVVAEPQVTEVDLQSSNNAVRGWKPQTLKAPVLLAFATTSFVLAGIVELFAQLSQRRGGFGLSASADDIPSPLALAYHYLPTLISVLYGFVWTWVEVDIRRIQPWLELSKPEGATAESSLLLDYPFDFVAFVPVKAWRRRHWPVFYASVIMIIVFWAITPLQSAVFSLQQISIVESVLMVQSSLLLHPAQQTSAIDESILNGAYGITWLGQEYPPFTTADYALLPFAPEIQTSASFPDELWTGMTIKLSANLSCWPAITTPTPGVPMTYTFDNGRGCVATNLSMLVNGEFTVYYVGYYDSAQNDWALQSPTCGANSSNQFLAIYLQATLPSPKQPSQLTALFCEPSYWQQGVQVAVSAASKTPDDNSVLAMSEMVELPPSEFNSSALDYLLSTSLPPIDEPRDWPDETVLDQYFELANDNLSWPYTPMVGFALGLSNASLDQLSNPTLLEAAFTAAHKTIFSVTVSKLLQSVNSSEASAGTIQDNKFGIVVNRPIAAAVEGLLVLVGVLTLATFVSCHRRKSNLVQEPSSMASLFLMIQKSPNLLTSFSGKDSFEAARFRRSLQGERYMLTNEDQPSGACRAKLDLVDDETQKRFDPSINTSVRYVPAHPTELRPLAGIAFIGTMLAAIATLTYLKIQELSLHGLPRPTNNTEVLQILEHYLPTAFATVLDLFLVVLNRLLCILQPFHDLRRGHKSAKRAIETRYTSLPPQFTLFLSLEARHFLLSALCSASLLANALTVALGGMFSELPVSVNYPVTVQQSQLSVFQRTDFVSLYSIEGLEEYLGHFYVVMANMSAGTRLPPWVDSSFAFLPFTTPENGSVIYQAQTRGFGVDLNCSTLSTNASSPDYIEISLSNTANNTGPESYSVHLTANDGVRWTCPMATREAPPIPSGALAQEIFGSLESPSGALDDDGFCANQLVMSWIRSNSEDLATDFKGTHIQCQPAFRSAIFNVTVDSQGYVLESTRIGDFDNATGNTPDQINNITTQANFQITYVGSLTWHNTTVTTDWMNYLLTLYLNSTALVDPSHDIPEPEYVIPAVGAIYQRLFAALLGLNLSMFKSTAVPAEIPGVMSMTETRIFMDKTAYVVSMSILVFNVALGVFIYLRESKPFLPRMPSTIGSLLAYCAPSRAVREYEGYDSSGKKRGLETRSNVTYSFGSYVGVDGKPHVGIERDPFVASLQPRAGLLSRRRGRRRSP